MESRTLFPGPLPVFYPQQNQSKTCRPACCQESLWYAADKHRMCHKATAQIFRVNENRSVLPCGDVPRTLRNVYPARTKRHNFGGSRPHAKLSYLVVEACDLLLTGSGQQERIHLGLQGVIHLHIYIVARRLLLVVGIHTEAQTDVQTLHLRWGRNNCFE